MPRRPGPQVRDEHLAVRVDRGKLREGGAEAASGGPRLRIVFDDGLPEPPKCLTRDILENLVLQHTGRQAARLHLPRCPCAARALPKGGKPREVGHEPGLPEHNAETGLPDSTAARRISIEPCGM